jgi:hypothetical protein
MFKNEKIGSREKLPTSKAFQHLSIRTGDIYKRLTITILLS